MAKRGSFLSRPTWELGFLFPFSCFRGAVYPVLVVVCFTAATVFWSGGHLEGGALWCDIGVGGVIALTRGQGGGLYHGLSRAEISCSF